MRTILKTIHGSHLYGLARPESDRDEYRVVLAEDSRFTHQSKEGDDDQVVIGLNRFTEQVALGVPQALEALWSPIAVIDPQWAPFFRTLRPGVTETQMRYPRTILNFGINRGGRTGAARDRVDPRKLRRHALRLVLNLSDFLALGRFDPRLTEEQVAWVIETADRPDFENVLIARLDAALWT